MRLSRDKIRRFLRIISIIPTAVSIVGLEAAHGPIFSVANASNWSISGTKCLRLGLREARIRTTAQLRQLEMNISHAKDTKTLAELDETYERENVHVLWLGFARICLAL